MNFLKQANSAFKSAKELEKNLASVGITKEKFTGKKAGDPAAATHVAPTDGSQGQVNTYGQPPNNNYQNTGGPPGSYGAPQQSYGQPGANYQPGAPTDPSHGQQQHTYGQPPNNNYQASPPPSNTYSPPPQNTYGAPHDASNNAYQQGNVQHSYGAPPNNNYGAPLQDGHSNSYAPPPGQNNAPGQVSSPPLSSTGSSQVPPHIRQSYEARKPEFEARLAELKELAWAAALDSAAKNAHDDHQAAKTASPDYVLDALTRLQEHVKKFEK